MTKIPHIDIDATGLLCPQPLLRLKTVVNEKSVGEQVCIAVTDEHAELDFQVWCERFGHKLIGPIQQLNQQLFVITKGVKN
ncbi:sulfurtransferase TusA family protein [Marinicella gelatinilytica]|uniref:sulfurtransferase TusA family protein n=1 Tax=Marinicella gelatinilytica TaxID=2996017 RepID=UPI002260FB17|nr:sulfurtransferase TusA family protein [Marinicella gelatinilytica]MCX7545599.1 sulfurtransferase TusA family protein [Marinicella gelatinilytica]